MTEKLPRITISDAQPLRTADLRAHDVFMTADPNSELPDVVLAGPPLNRARNAHGVIVAPVGINDVSGEGIGVLNVVQTPDHNSWLNDVEINRDRRGEQLGVTTYLGVMAALHSVGRQLESDPSGLSDSSTGVWNSLVRRGVAEVVQDQVDQHGNPRFKSILPTAEGADS